ncbi:hypothetical protein AX14_008445 [Amanita brunnescens Koide BX004]|nr:hypothetical protein AX14_008445 [Amanita brunnescens Koide BX004]
MHVLSNRRVRRVTWAVASRHRRGTGRWSLDLRSPAGKNHRRSQASLTVITAIISIKVHQELCGPEENNCEEGTGAEPADAGPLEMDTEVEKETVEVPPLEWYLGVSEDLKVVIRSFPPPSEGAAGAANEWPVWELTTRDEAIDEDNPSTALPVVGDPRAANNPMRREYYTRPDRFSSYERNFWPSRVDLR